MDLALLGRSSKWIPFINTLGECWSLTLETSDFPTLCSLWSLIQMCCTCLESITEASSPAGTCNSWSSLCCISPGSAAAGCHSIQGLSWRCRSPQKGRHGHHEISSALHAWWRIEASLASWQRQLTIALKTAMHHEPMQRFQKQIWLRVFLAICVGDNWSQKGLDCQGSLESLIPCAITILVRSSLSGFRQWPRSRT